MYCRSRVFSVLVLAAFCGSTAAATLEKPVFAKFKGTPLNENPISGYVQFGQLRDGSPAIQKIDVSTVRLYERSTLLKLSIGEDTYAVEELNCKTGMLQVVGMGVLEQVTALDDPPDAQSIKDMHPKNLRVYREACTTVGIQPSW